MLTLNKKTINKIIPEYSVVPLIIAIIWNCAAYWGGRAIGQHLPHRMLALSADNNIPFLPWTVTIYVLTYVYWVINYILISRRDIEHVSRFFLADFITRTAALVLFIAVPTMTVRPEITGTGFFDRALGLIYTLDAPDNLFPSIHCIASTMAAIGIATEKKVPLWYRICSFFITAAICISTLTTKQHVIVDVISGVGIPFIAYAAAGNKKLAEKYMGVMLRIKK